MADTARLSADELIAKNRRTYFVIQIGFVIVGALLMVGVAQLFVQTQFLAMVVMAAAFDGFRAFIINWSKLDDSEADQRERKMLHRFFWSSLPRRWFEYALIALPLNTLVAYALYGPDFTEMGNLAAIFAGYIQEVAGMLVSEANELQSGLAALTMDLGVVGLLEYLAVRLLFRQRKISLN